MSSYYYAGNNPIMMNDPIGNVFASDDDGTGTSPDGGSGGSVEAAPLPANTDSQNGPGGSSSNSNSSTFSFEDNPLQAFYNVASYMQANDLWGSSPGYADSYSDAAKTFNNQLKLSKMDNLPFLT